MNFSGLKEQIKLNVKNLPGWKTNRKIVVFSVDDYGNVRLDSRKARLKMDKAGLKVFNRFDALDTLETRVDLELLYETLETVKDRNGRNAVFTPFAVPCNINFEKIAENGYTEYVYEKLSETFKKLADKQPDAYNGTWSLWKEGIEKGIMAPQFHGREHLNLKVFEEKLDRRDHDLMAALKNRSYTSVESKEYETISPMAAFDFWSLEENERFKEVIGDGLNNFEDVFGYRSDHFTPPVYSVHSILYSTLKENGVKYIDKAFIKREHQGKGKYKYQFNSTGKRNKYDQIFLVRNVVFEPSDDRGLDWVSFAMKQIEAAFRWNRPAIISSHRVNFCGHIDEKNRQEGLKSLKELLKKIVHRWPEVEFMAANELGELIEGNIKNS